jgi:hypothetical protein
MVPTISRIFVVLDYKTIRNIIKMLSYTYTLLKPVKGAPIRLFHCLSYLFHSHFTEN